MNNPNNYNYWSDTENFGKQIGACIYTLLSQASDEISKPLIKNEDTPKEADIQLTNISGQSIIITE